MSVQNDKLIEEAERRYPDIEADPETFPTGWSRKQERNAFIAGAAFEKALTPTDDEREDMIAFLLRDHNFEESPWGRTYTDAEIANALRRSEVPEPSAEPTCEHGASITELCEHVERLVNAEPQGEPSDAQVNAALIAYWGGEKSTHLMGSMDGMRAALRAAGAVGHVCGEPAYFASSAALREDLESPAIPEQRKDSIRAELVRRHGPSAGDVR